MCKASYTLCDFRPSQKNDNHCERNVPNSLVFALIWWSALWDRLKDSCCHGLVMKDSVPQKLRWPSLGVSAAGCYINQLADRDDTEYVLFLGMDIDSMCHRMHFSLYFHCAICLHVVPQLPHVSCCTVSLAVKPKSQEVGETWDCLITACA